MDTLLDLEVAIAARPPDASTDAAMPLTLRCQALNAQVEGATFSSSLTSQERNDLRWYLEDYWRWPFAGFALRGSDIEQHLPILGQRLYQAVFGQAAADLVRQWRAADGAHQVSIVTDDAGFLSLPWELLHDGQGYLALRAEAPVSIVRRLAQVESPPQETASFEKPLRVLMVTSRPEDAGQVDVRTVAREVVDALQEQREAGTVEVEFLRPPTLEQLEARLSDRQRPVHILHFDGHGEFRRAPIGGQSDGVEGGQLLFENARGKADPVDAETLALTLSTGGVRLAVLNACQSATLGEKDSSSSVAVRLLSEGGVQAVVAMSASVTATGAALYVRALYGALASGASVQAAHEQAQRVLSEHPERSPLQQRPDEAATPITLRDWWLPYLYLQRPFALQPVETRSVPLPAPAEAAASPDKDVSAAPPSPEFIGRSTELLTIERLLLRGGIVLVSGFGGVGKTALAREAADWLTRTGMFDSACFVSFEHGGDASLLLSALGEALALNNGSYHPYDPPTALDVLAPVLVQRHALIVADNIESVLPGGDAALDDAGRQQLWETLMQLQRAGAGILITSRSPHLDEGRLPQGMMVAPLALGGLAPDDAYALALRVLASHRIDPSHVPYADLNDLLDQLDRHPLAIMLTLPALRELPLATVRTDLASLLGNVQNDDQAGERHRSLQASLDYSLKWLSDGQRALLSRLAPFEGGALELNLLNVTGMSQEEWSDLRQALERAGLLTQEQPFEGIKMPLQHFHPVLTPYLRGLPGANDAALRESYVTIYYQFAYYLSTVEQGQRQTTNKRQGQIARAWARAEFPNLRRSLDLLLAGGDVGLITAEADILTRFLDYFGRLRERDALRRAVLEAIRPGGAQDSDALTWAAYWQEKSLGEQELERGDWQAAAKRFQALAFAMSSLPEGEELGPRTLAQATILQRLARALKAGGQYDEATSRIQEALAITGEILERQKDQPDSELMYTRCTLLIDSGDLLRYQGQYDQAKQAYEEGLQIARNAKDQRSQAVALAQLGSLGLAQKDYTGALTQFRDSAAMCDLLGEKALKATVLHQMGVTSADLALAIHVRREIWAGGSPLPPVLSLESEQAVLGEGEQSYRESLRLREQLGDEIEAAGTSFQLGLLAERTGRYDEARDWFMRARDMYERAAPGSRSLMVCLSGMAQLLVDPDYPDRAAHLAEAHQAAEQALQMAERLPVEDDTWALYRTRATIAELEGHSDEAESYWRRQREVYAAFPAHRTEIEKTYGPFIAQVAAATGGDAQARAQVEATLALFEANEQMRPVAAAVRRLMAGERDWHTLSRGIAPQTALALRCVLEALQK